MQKLKPVVILASLLAMLASEGCRKPKPYVLTRKQQQKVNDAILKEAPKPQYLINAVFDDKIRLIGVDIGTGKTPEAGTVLPLTFYWECLKETDGKSRWMIFVHLEGPTAQGGTARATGDHDAVEEAPKPGARGLYPISQWKKGQIIKDTKTMKLENRNKVAMGPGEVALYVGIFDIDQWRNHKKNVRMKISNVKGGLVNEDRLTVRKFKVVPTQAKTAARRQRSRTLKVYKGVGPIQIDGQLNEPSWARAQSSPVFGRASEGTAASRDMATQVKTLWSDQRL
jgi:hypothetical protein